MAMYPNATAHGYMPFVTPAHRRQAAKKSRMDHKEASKAKTGELKTYKVTLRDKHGVTLTYIIQADPNSKTMPILCESMVSLAGPKPKDRFFNSLPNMESPEAKLNALLGSEPSSPESRRHVLLAQGKEDLSKLNDFDLSKTGDDRGKKGLFNSLLSYIRKKTGSSKQSSSKPSPQVKSKRKAKPMFPKKRQRTVSQMSNLSPIQESPDEDNDDSDSDSFTHDSSDDSLSES